MRGAWESPSTRRSSPWLARARAGWCAARTSCLKAWKSTASGSKMSGASSLKDRACHCSARPICHGWARSKCPATIWFSNRRDALKAGRMSPPRQHPVLAFAVALAAVAVLSVMDAVMKGLVLAIGLYATSVWRALVGVGLSSILYLPQRRTWPSRQVIRLHLLRGAVVTVMGLLFFFGLARVPIAQAIALTFIAPLIALFLASLTLGERVGRRTVAASILAFAGVLAIVGGQARAELGEGVLVGTVAILGSAVCYAVNIVMMRKQSLSA